MMADVRLAEMQHGGYFADVKGTSSQNEYDSEPVRIAEGFKQTFHVNIYMNTCSCSQVHAEKGQSGLTIHTSLVCYSWVLVDTNRHHSEGSFLLRQSTGFLRHPFPSQTSMEPYAFSDTAAVLNGAVFQLLPEGTSQGVPFSLHRASIPCGRTPVELR